MSNPYAPQDAQTVPVHVQVIDLDPFALDMVVPTYLPASDLTQRVARDAGLGAYWPDGSSDFFESVGTTRADELARYDAVIFFETAAKGGHGFESENRFRTESQQQAIELDNALRAQWRDHPRFTLIPHSVSFFRKMTTSLAILESLVAQLPDP